MGRLRAGKCTPYGSRGGLEPGQWGHRLPGAVGEEVVVALRQFGEEGGEEVRVALSRPAAWQWTEKNSRLRVQAPVEDDA